MAEMIEYVSFSFFAQEQFVKNISKSPSLGSRCKYRFNSIRGTKLKNFILNYKSKEVQEMNLKVNTFLFSEK